MATRARRISSLAQFQRVVPAIVKAINADPQLALRAAANPLLAVEELGYTITPGVRQEAERRVRFSEQTVKQMAALEAQVYKLAGEKFEIDSGEALEGVLFEKLKLAPPEAGAPKGKSAQKREVAAQQAAALRPSTAPLPPRAVGHGPVADPLEPLRKAHPVMEPLLEYRQLEASSARLASPDLYERIRKGEVKMPVTSIKVSLQRGPTPK